MNSIFFEQRLREGRPRNLFPCEEEIRKAEIARREDLSSLLGQKDEGDEIEDDIEVVPSSSQKDDETKEQNLSQSSWTDAKEKELREKVKTIELVLFCFPSNLFFFV